MERTIEYLYWLNLNDSLRKWKPKKHASKYLVTKLKGIIINRKILIFRKNSDAPYAVCVPKVPNIDTGGFEYGYLYYAVVLDLRYHIKDDPECNPELNYLKNPLDNCLFLKIIII